MTFVTAFNGARDFFEVPLALHELDLLETHVSDFYVPDRFASLIDRGGRPIGKRRRAGLPSRMVTLSLTALAMQLPAVRRTYSNASYFKIIDREISRKAAAISDRTGADLFLHSGYAGSAFDGRGDRRRWLYQYHPHACSVREILARDAECFPEIRYSFERETDSQPQNTSTDVLSEWMDADEIFCASTFTANSLATQGCPRARIHVIPYGCDIAPAEPADERRGPCHFLFVGQGVQRKGLHHLLRAWRAADLRGSRLTVVARRLDPGLIALLDFRSIEYVVDVSPLDLQRLMAAADVFVMPSLVEGFGLVFLEALANGLFCIGTPNTGLPDLDLPMTSALVTPVGDVIQLQKALEDAAEMKGKGLLSKAAIKAGAENWSWDRHRSTLKTVVNVLIEAARPADRSLPFE